MVSHCPVQICTNLFYVSHKLNDVEHCVRYTKNSHFKACDGRKEIFYITMHTTHFICNYLILSIWSRSNHILIEITWCRHFMSYSSHRQNVIPVVEHWLGHEISQWINLMTWHIMSSSLPLSYILLNTSDGCDFNYSTQTIHGTSTGITSSPICTSVHTVNTDHWAVTHSYSEAFSETCELHIWHIALKESHLCW